MEGGSRASSAPFESLAGVGLVVVGEGPEERRLKLLSADLGMGDRVYFAGRLSKEESAALARVCDVFVLNSTYEGLPHVLAEAMTWGLPIVATAVGGTPETILNERNGLLVSPDDPDALPKALRRMTTDAELRGRLSSQARSDAAELFDPTLMAERTEAALLKRQPRVANWPWRRPLHVVTPAKGDLCITVTPALSRNPSAGSPGWMA